MNISMTDKWILVTGASSGIGKAVALLLLDAYNANIVAVSRNMKIMQDVYSAYGNRCRMISYDLVDLDHTHEIFMQIDVKLDGLVHCAGLSPLAKIEDNTSQIIRDTFAVNLFSFMELVKGFTQTGVSNSNSSIVSISSVATEFASYRQSVYSSSKSALEQFVRCAAKELLPKGIRVNAVSAGAVETEMLKALEHQSIGLRTKLENYYPLGLIDPKEVAEMIVWLLSDESQHIDGSIIKIDSGFFINK